jgi:integrase
MHPTPVDAAGHKRAAVTLPGYYHSGRPPRNKGRRYPAVPPTVEEIIAVMRAAGTGPDGARLWALIVVLWRAGLRIGEALALTESDMDPRRRAVLVRRGKGNKRREVGMDTWAWEQLQPWQQVRTRPSSRPSPPRGISGAHPNEGCLRGCPILHAIAPALLSATDESQGAGQKISGVVSVGWSVAMG